MENASAWYQQTKPLLRRIARQHQECYGGDEEEILAEAEYYCVLACERFERQSYWRTPHGWIAYFVLRQLRDDARKHVRRRKLANKEQVPLDTLPEKNGWNLHAFAEELSEDARAIIELTVGPHYRSLFSEKKKGLNRTEQRNALKSFLRGAGWTWQRIMHAFEEIQEALQ